MKFLPQRKSPRLQGYDYSQSGAYFVTICAHQRLSLFGQVLDGLMMLSQIGAIVESEWLHTAAARPYVELDAFVIMPNHMHGAIIIHDDTGSTRHVHNVTGANFTHVGRGLARQIPTNPQFGKPIDGALGTIIGAYKGAVTRHVNRLPDPPDHPIWQRNYHDHIIRSEADLNRIREYVIHNPARWQDDTLHV